MPTELQVLTGFPCDINCGNCVNSLNYKFDMVKKYSIELSNHFTTVEMMIKNGANHEPTTKLAQCYFKFNC